MVYGEVTQCKSLFANSDQLEAMFYILFCFSRITLLLTRMKSKKELSKESDYILSQGLLTQFDIFWPSISCIIA